VQPDVGFGERAWTGSSQTRGTAPLNPRAKFGLQASNPFFALRLGDFSRENPGGGSETLQ
jgi:hypothetical protein